MFWSYRSRIITRPKERDREAKAKNRPACPRCGAHGLNKEGKFQIYDDTRKWSCNVCHRKWFKDAINEVDLSTYTDEPHLEGNFLLIFDPHFPFHHVTAFDHAKEMCQKWMITKCIIPGDSLDLDSFKKFLDKHPDIQNWEEEKELTRGGLKWLASWMSEIHLLMGNHELRQWKRLEGKGDQLDIYELLLGDFDDETKKKFHYYLYPYAVINSSWIVDHPNMTSTIPGRVPFRLSSKYMVRHLMGLIEEGIKPLNGQYGYISGHGHLGGETMDDSGCIQVADGMVMCNPQMFSYYMLKRNSRPSWRVGFNILRDNYLYRFPEDTTDWRWWLGVE